MTTTFALGTGDTYFVAFVKERPSAGQAKALEALSNDFDMLVVQGRDVHWLMHGRSIETRITTKAWDAIVGRHRSTSRNATRPRRLMERMQAGG
ncbi:MAG TPA: hypothetical protein VHT97_02235 [Acidimicrobiales bacterium]|jgi:hypothetical protein|nr:hypothetical protein [Acidimicrobiales bacterium]